LNNHFKKTLKYQFTPLIKNEPQLVDTQKPRSKAALLPKTCYGVEMSEQITSSLRAGDHTPPQLLELSFPDVFDLSSGEIPVTFTAKASDVGSGIQNVVVWLSDGLSTNIGNFNLWGVYDGWDDSTPNLASSTQIVQPYNNPGVYHITSVSVIDKAGNSTSYSPTQLTEIGIKTSFTIIGSSADYSPPELISLDFPSVIDISAGEVPVIFTARASDVGSGIQNVVVWLSDGLSTNIGNFNLWGVYDGWDDSTPNLASSTQIVQPYNNPGIYHITSVSVTDKAGNSTSYSPTQLTGMGIKTSFTLAGGSADYSPPELISLDFPSVIDISAGEVPVTFTARASDVGSGIQNVVVWLSDGLSTNIGNFNLWGVYDGWDDSTPNLASSTQIVQPYNNPGIYHITSVSVTDKAGNSTSYSPAELGQMGINTFFTLTHGIPTTELHGTAGADILQHPGSGDHWIDGGAGLDTVVYSLPSAMYAISARDDGFMVVGPNGTDTLTSIERLQFSDTKIALDINGSAGSVYRLYQAAFDRAPDKAGLGYWIHQADAGMSLSEISSGFIDSNEFRQRYGDNLDNKNFLENLYLNVLGRTYDQAGFDYWMNELETGSMTREGTLAGFSESNENKENLIGQIGNGFDYIEYIPLI
jgi:hypothetical protein